MLATDTAHAATSDSQRIATESGDVIMNMAQNDDTRLNTRVVMPHQGDADVLMIVRTDTSRAPSRGEVTLHVEAAGVSFAEVQMLRGRYFNQPKFPFVPGYDLVGTVTAIGDGVDETLVGRRVAALTETGAWAGRVTLPAKGLVTVPDGVDAAPAVAVVTNGVTAWQMVHRAARVQPGQTVVVHGASGGVGTLLVQLARLAGATVIGTASASKHDAVRALGAVPIDYRTENVPGAVRRIAPDGVDAVFDHVGGPGLADSWRMLRRGGALISYGSASTLTGSGHRLLPYVPLLGRLLLWNALPNGQRMSFYYVKRWPRFFHEDLSLVLSLLADGKIEAQVARKLPLERAAEGLGLLASGTVSGKVVLVPGMVTSDREGAS